MTAPLPLFSWPTPATSPAMGFAEAVAVVGAAADERGRPAVVEPPQGLRAGDRVYWHGCEWRVRFEADGVVELIGPTGYAAASASAVRRV